MSTLAELKALIADDLDRDDMDSQIAKAVSSAISHYEGTRFWFNEKRDIEFTLSSSQEFYGVNDSPYIPNLIEIDAFSVIQSGTPNPIYRRDYDWIERTAMNGVAGLPSDYAYYGQEIRFYPIPDGTGSMTARIAAHVRLDSLSDSQENAWTTEAENLIRYRACWELSQNVIKDYEAADRYKPMEIDALQRLEAETTRRRTTGRVRASQF